MTAYAHLPLPHSGLGPGPVGHGKNTILGTRLHGPTCRLHGPTCRAWALHRPYFLTRPTVQPEGYKPEVACKLQRVQLARISAVAMRSESVLCMQNCLSRLATQVRELRADARRFACNER